MPHDHSRGDGYAALALQGVSRAEIARRSGVNASAVGSALRMWERRNGQELPKSKGGRPPLSAPKRPRVQAKPRPVVEDDDVQVDDAPGCERCGLRGEHACLPRAESFLRTRNTDDRLPSMDGLQQGRRAARP